MIRAYRILLRLYPSDYRHMFAGEMLNAFALALDERRRRGTPGEIGFVLGEFMGLIGGACAEWIAKCTTNGTTRKIGFAGARASRHALPEEVVEVQGRIAVLIERTVHAIANHDFPGARTYSHEEREARENLRRLREQYRLTE
jgi:hypothetical protein